MKKLFQKIGQSFKEETNRKQLLLWAVAGFVVILVVVAMANRELSAAQVLLEAAGMDLVLVLMLLFTRVYGNLLDGYYGSFKKRFKK
ncbi:MAG: hypothetical protein IJ225_00555 [Solobacterium sp.]|nr:hypothetical protein [Solobacterium sp.]